MYNVSLTTINLLRNLRVYLQGSHCQSASSLFTRVKRKKKKTKFFKEKVRAIQKVCSCQKMINSEWLTSHISYTTLLQREFFASILKWLCFKFHRPCQSRSSYAFLVFFWLCHFAVAYAKIICFWHCASPISFWLILKRHSNSIRAGIPMPVLVISFISMLKYFACHNWGRWFKIITHIVVFFWSGRENDTCSSSYSCLLDVNDGSIKCNCFVFRITFVDDCRLIGTNSGMWFFWL